MEHSNVLRIVFKERADDPTTLEFVEIEDGFGKSIRIDSWVDDPAGFRVLELHHNVILHQPINSYTWEPADNALSCLETLTHGASDSKAARYAREFKAWLAMAKAFSDKYQEKVNAIYKGITDLLGWCHDLVHTYGDETAEWGKSVLEPALKIGQERMAALDKAQARAAAVGVLGDRSEKELNNLVASLDHYPYSHQINIDLGKLRGLLHDRAQAAAVAAVLRSVPPPKEKAKQRAEEDQNENG